MIASQYRLILSCSFVIGEQMFFVELFLSNPYLERVLRLLKCLNIEIICAGIAAGVTHAQKQLTAMRIRFLMFYT